MPAQASSGARLSYLSVARSAANASLAPKPESARSRSKKPRVNRTRLILYGGVLPVAIIGAGAMMLSRHPVTAQPNHPGAIRVVKTQTAPQAQKVAQQPAPASAAISVPSTPAAAPLSAAPAPAPVVEQNPIPATPVQNASLSLDELQKRVAAGDLQAERDLGLKYLNGDGVAPDVTAAARWLMTAAYKGDPSAELWLGTLYATGEGLPKDAFQQAHWYGAAAKRGNVQAMINLATLYERGQGVPQDFAEAYKWYAIAASRGDMTADEHLTILDKELKPSDLTAAKQAATRFKSTAPDESINSAGAVPPH
jgi:hypothetical protein